MCIGRVRLTRKHMVDGGAVARGVDVEVGLTKCRAGVVLSGGGSSPWEDKAVSWVFGRG